MSGQPKKLRMEEGKADTATRSPPKKSRTTQTIPKKKKLKSEAEKVKEKSGETPFGQGGNHPGRSISHDQSAEAGAVCGCRCPFCGTSGSGAV